MSIRIEVTVSVFEDGLFKSRDMAVSDNSDGIREAFEQVMVMIENKLAEAAIKKEHIDDDIPF